MTPAEESYAAAWLSECWRTVREYVPTIAERATAQQQQERLAQSSTTGDKNVDRGAA